VRKINAYEEALKSQLDYQAMLEGAKNEGARKDVKKDRTRIERGQKKGRT
jgi:hypothetical protein